MRIVLVVLACWCSVLAADPDPWSELPDDARGLVEAIIASNRVLEPELDEPSMRRDFLGLVRECRLASGASDAAAAIARMNSRILRGRSVTYLSNQYWRDSSFVAALQRRKGNCLATTTLYVAVSRALGLPVHAVFIPGHAFVCWSDDRGRFNIETTDGGRLTPDIDYLMRYSIDPVQTAYFGWMAPAGDDRLIAELHLVAAKHLAGQQRLDEALGWLQRVTDAQRHRDDLRLLAATWEADRTGNRSPLRTLARNMVSDPRAASPTTLAAWRTLAAEYRGELNRTAERDALRRAWALAPWQDQDQILEMLSVCLRGLRDHQGAVLCMELAVARDPKDLRKQAWLAGMMSEAGRLPEALELIAQVRRQNPEEVHYQNMEAGMLVLAGQREEGRRRFDAIRPPRTNLSSYETNRAWFLAVWGDREEFYPQFEKALTLAHSPAILSWIAEDDDLDAYRQDERFIALVAAAKMRLLGRP
jgi:tetratricopeptide (TPR) repeat protein